jgi:hypothetical protein
MSARVGFTVWGYLREKRGKSTKEKASSVLTPPFASEKNARDFAEVLKKRGYVVTSIRWHS